MRADNDEEKIVVTLSRGSVHVYPESTDPHLMTDKIGYLVNYTDRDGVEFTDRFPFQNVVCITEREG